MAPILRLCKCDHTVTDHSKKDNINYKKGECMYFDCDCKGYIFKENYNTSSIKHPDPMFNEAIDDRRRKNKHVYNMNNLDENGHPFRFG